MLWLDVFIEIAFGIGVISAEVALEVVAMRTMMKSQLILRDHSVADRAFNPFVSQTVHEQRCSVLVNLLANPALGIVFLVDLFLMLPKVFQS